MPATLTFFVLHNDVYKHFLLLVYRTAVAKTYVTYWSGPNTAAKPLCFWSFPLSRKQVQDLPFHYTFFSTNERDEQRRIRLHIHCSSSNLFHMIQCNKCNVQKMGESKRHLGDGFDEHRQKSSHDNTLINQPCFRSLYPCCQFYGQHRTRSSRKDHFK